MSETVRKRKFIPDRVLLAGAVFMAVVIVMNENVRRFGQLVLPGGVSTVGRVVLYAAVMYVVMGWMKRQAGQSSLLISEPQNEYGSETARTVSLSGIIPLAAVFFAVYFIWLLIFYPGVMYWDSMRQINDFFDGHTTGPYFALMDAEVSAFLNDHDSVFDTILFGVFIQIGNLFHSPAFGMFLYCLIQAALFALLFAYIVTEIGHMGCPKWLYIAAILFFLHPFVCIYAIMMLKDVIFALCFIPYYLVFLCIAGGEAEKKHIILLAVLSLFCALTKKPGIYIVAISNAVLLVYLLIRKQSAWKGVLAGLAIPAAVSFWLLPRVVYPAFNVFPGGKGEALAVCFQTTFTLLKENEAAISVQDREIIDKVIDYEGLKRDTYLSHTADNAKHWFRLSASGNDIAAYMKYWLRTGFRHPSLYLRTVCALNGGFFSPTEPLEIYISASPLAPEDNYPGIENNPRTLPLREDMVRLYEVLRDTPPFSFFFQNVLYSWLIPAGTALLMIANGRKRDLIGLVPVLLALLVLIAGPESTTRFATHLIFLAPFLLAMALRRETYVRNGN